MEYLLIHTVHARRMYMERKIYKPKTKGLFLLITIIYFIVTISSIVLHFTSIESFGTRTFLYGSFIYWFWCLTLLAIIKSQRIILEKDGTFRYKTLGINRCVFHTKQLVEVIKEKMNGHPVYVLKYSGNRKRKPIPYLPFEEEWNEIILWFKKHNDTFTCDEKIPHFRHTYKKYDYVEKP